MTETLETAPVVKVIVQREASDCAIAALAMFLGKTYEDVLRAVTQVDKAQGRKGLYLTQIIKVAALLGYQLKKRRKWDLETDCGLLRLDLHTGEAHMVLLTHGLVIEGDGTIWEADTFFQNKKAVPTNLLTL